MERVGIDVRVQGRQAAEQDLQRIARELRELGGRTGDLGQGAGDAGRDFDRAMREIIEAARRAGVDVGGDLGGIRDDLGGLGDDADRGVGGIRDAFGDLDVDSLLGGDISGLVGGAGAWGIAGAAAASAFAWAYKDQLGQEMATDRASGMAGAFAAGDQAALSQTVDDLWMGAYGDSYEEVASAVAAVSNATAGLGLGFDELTGPAEAALVLADATGASAEEIILGVANLARTTGTDIMTVFDQVAASGDRINGVFREDLFDVLGEYPAQLQALGLSSDDLLTVLGEASTAGVTNLDVVADSLKEFGVVIRGGGQPVIDALESLSLNADDIIGGFAAGGPEARQALLDVLEALQEVDEVTRYEAAATLGAGPLENLGLGVQGIEILASFEDGLTNVEGAMTRLGDVMYDNDATLWTAQVRELKENVAELLAPVGQTVVGGINELFQLFEDGLDPTSPAGRFFEFHRDGWDDLSSLIDDAVDAVPGLSSAFERMGDVTGGILDSVVGELSRVYEGIRDVLGLGNAAISGSVAGAAVAGGYIEGKGPEIDINPWGGGGAATWQPSTQAPTVIQVYAMDSESFADFARRHGEILADEVGMVQARKAVTA